MQALLKNVSKVNSLVSAGSKLTGVRTYYVVSGPPQRPIPKSERMAIMTFFFVSCLAVPAWVTYHIPIYNKKK